MKRLTREEAKALLATPSKKKHKYNAEKVVIDGMTFDSRREAKRWSDLKILERAGKIEHLCRQVTYNLVCGVKLHGAKRARPAIRYIADFVYQDDDGYVVIEDAKGFDTSEARLKRHLMLALRGLEVRLV